MPDVVAAGQLVTMFGSGVAVALTTSIPAPALKRRCSQKDLDEGKTAGVEIARLGAVDRFQERLLERMHELEDRKPEMAEPIAKLMSAIDDLLLVKRCYWRRYRA